MSQDRLCEKLTAGDWLQLSQYPGTGLSVQQVVLGSAAIGEGNNLVSGGYYYRQ
ncbi:hypothetical protein ACRTDR_02420 [Shewanella algae]